MALSRSIRLASALVVLVALRGYAATPALVILQEGVDMSAKSSALEASGARIRQRIPPRVLIADFEKAKPSVPGASAVYTGPVPLSVLEPLGPVAVAAGISWNRQQLATAVQAGAAGAMRQSIASRSLTSPISLSVIPTVDRLLCSWPAVDGAIFYEVQASADPSFTSLYAFTSAREPAVSLALPDTAGTAYVRVRAVDLGHEGEDDDIRGAWTQAVTVMTPSVPSSSGAAPALTAPDDGAGTHGTTLLLEWTGATATRIQVSRSADFSTKVFDEITDATPYACASQAMTVGDRLYWRARSEAPFRSAWSEIRVVTIAPTAPEKVDALINPEAPQ